MPNKTYWLIKDKKTGEQLAKIENEASVLPFAHKVGRSTVEIEKVEGKKNMTEQRIVNLSEMMIEVVSTSVLLPQTKNPLKEAQEMTRETGLYHYVQSDDLIGKSVIVNTNIEALTEAEWIKKAFKSTVNEETPVIEPSNFEKNDQYEVTDSDQVAEGYDRDAWEAGYEAFEQGKPCPSDASGKDGWMEAKKEHRKSGQMDEADYDRGNSDNWDDDHSPAPEWSEVYTGLFKHNYLPLAYDDNSGQVILYDIDGVSNINDAEVVGSFENVEEMNAWIAANINESVASQYREIAETEADAMVNHGVNNKDGDEFGPAPVEDQNKMEFDADGKFELSEDEQADLIAKAKRARDESKNGYVQHVDKLENGGYGVSDWMSDDTVVSYSNGYCINGDDPLDGMDESLDEAKFKPKDSSFDSYIDLSDRDDVEVEVFYEVEESDSSVGYPGGVIVTGVVEKGTENDLTDSLSQSSMMRLQQEAEEDATGQHTDYADYKYDQMRDERMERDFEEGKDYRYDPDADDEDYDRQERFKQRKNDKSARRKDVTEADGDIERAYLLAVDFTHERLELLHKGMSDVDSAIAMMADGRPTEPFLNELHMGGLPMAIDLDRDNNHTLIVLASTFRGAIDAMLEMESCHELLTGLEIGEDHFYGFLIQGKTGDMMDNTTELAEEDEMFEAPEFVVSSENLYADEMAQDPMFAQVMNDAYLAMAEKLGEKVEEFNPSIDEVDGIIEMGIDSYPNGAKYSFMMSDPMARDAINDAFNILWDQGKIGPEHMA